jgi:hypothetical protein
MSALAPTLEAFFTDRLIKLRLCGARRPEPSRPSARPAVARHNSALGIRRLMRTSA